ncbi:hypothetical protein B0H11DRAFT_2266323 [Mycena galericulata]|nr:hypothetical protein B0H11DRAFT_2266323 [Mycena galericulata]
MLPSLLRVPHAISPIIILDATIAPLSARPPPLCTNEAYGALENDTMHPDTCNPPTREDARTIWHWQWIGAHVCLPEALDHIHPTYTPPSLPTTLHDGSGESLRAQRVARRPQEPSTMPRHTHPLLSRERTKHTPPLPPIVVATMHCTHPR